MNHYAGRMTKTYAAKRLLEHGPLTLREFTSITGWGGDASSSCLLSMVSQGIVSIQNINGKRHYSLTGDIDV